jgi:hypothetical protein
MSSANWERRDFLGQGCERIRDIIRLRDVPLEFII